MKKQLLIIGLLLFPLFSNAQLVSKQNVSVTDLINQKNQKNKPLKDALIQFNLSVSNSFSDNTYFGTMVYQYFLKKGMSISEIRSMMESLEHNFTNTEKLLKMFKDVYQSEESIFKGLYVLNIGANNSDELSKYIVNNF